MSDGHTDAAKYSRFFQEQLRIEQEKLENTYLVLEDMSIVNLKDTMLLFCNDKVDVGDTFCEESPPEGSKTKGMRELVMKMIKKGIV